MVHILSFALFSTVLLVSILTIIATAKAELPYVLRALGIDPVPVPPLTPGGERRVRVIRQAKLAQAPSGLRAAA